MKQPDLYYAGGVNVLYNLENNTPEKSVLQIDEREEKYRQQYPQYSELLEIADNDFERRVFGREKNIMPIHEILQLSEELSADAFHKSIDDIITIWRKVEEYLEYFMSRQQVIAEVRSNFEKKNTIEQLRDIHQVYINERLTEIYKINFFVPSQQYEELIKFVRDTLTKYEHTVKDVVDLLLELDQESQGEWDSKKNIKRNEIITRLLYTNNPIVVDSYVDTAHTIYKEFVNKGYQMEQEGRYVESRQFTSVGERFFAEVQRVKDNEEAYKKLVDKYRFVFKGDLALAKISEEVSPEDIENVHYDENIIEHIQDNENIQTLLENYLATKIDDYNIKSFAIEGELDILKSTSSKLIKLDIMHNLQVRFWDYLNLLPQVKEQWKDLPIDFRQIGDMLDTYFDNFFDYPKLQKILLKSFVDKLLHSTNTKVYRYVKKDGKREKTLAFLRIDHISQKRKYLGSFNVASFNIVDNMKGLNLGFSLLDKVLNGFEEDVIVEADAIPQTAIIGYYINRYHFIVDSITENYKDTGVDLFHITRESKNKNYYFQNELSNEELKKEIISSIEQVNENTNHFIIKLTKDNITQQTKQLLSKGFVLTKYDIDKDDGNIYCGFEKKITE